MVLQRWAAGLQCHKWKRSQVVVSLEYTLGKSEPFLISLTTLDHCQCSLLHTATQQVLWRPSPWLTRPEKVWHRSASSESEQNLSCFPNFLEKIVYFYPVFIQVVIMLKRVGVSGQDGVRGLGKITPFIWCIITDYWCLVSLLCFVLSLIKNSVTQINVCSLIKCIQIQTEMTFQTKRTKGKKELK